MKLKLYCLHFSVFPAVFLFVYCAHFKGLLLQTMKEAQLVVPASKNKYNR